MVLKKISRKARIAYNLLKDEGAIAVGIRSLEFVQKHQKSTQPSSQKGKVYTHARYEDILRADLNKGATINASKQTKLPMKFAWIMPPPGKGSGGHMNIFRFIDFLEKKGYECHIYLYVNGQHGSVEGVRAVMGESYPKIKAAENMKWLDEGTEIKGMGGIFATSWETAYASYSLTSKAKRFYFVQDFEPYFYPVGGMSTLAENTYKMNFFGVTAGGWLKKKLASEYQMRTDSFDFGSDPSTYRFENEGKRKEIFCYVRPYTERRGFEVGVLALDIFHKMHPEYIINLVGWDVSQYDLPFPHKNLQVLEVNELSDLYNRCIAGLVLSYTNMSLLPLELLGCGTIPVVNDADNNRLVSNNPYIAYSQNDPHSLANKLSEIVTRQNAEEYAKEAAKSVTNSGWEKSGKKFVSIVEKEMNHNG